MIGGWRETSHHALFWDWPATAHRQNHLSSGGMSGCPGEFLSPSLGIDPPPFAPQIFRSAGPFTVKDRDVRHGQL